MTTPLFFFALAALVVFTLLPLFKPWRPLVESLNAGERQVQALEQKSAASLRALKDLEFERDTGKMSDGNYEELKDFYAREAAKAQRALEALKAGPVADKGRGPGRQRLQALEQDKIASLRALKDLEFERATGKLSDEDYEELRDFYSRKAAQALKALEGLQAPGAAVEEPGAGAGA